MEVENNKKMTRQIIIASTLMVLILVLVFFVHESKSMNQKEVLEVMEKSANYRNFSMKVVKTEANTKEETEVKIKDNIKVEKQQASYCWTNYETGEQIKIDYNEKIAIIEKVEKQEYQFFTPEKYGTYNYKYLGEKDEDEKKHSLIAYKSDKYYVEAVLDIELGIDIKEEIYNLQGKMKKGTLNKILEIKEFVLNKVTEQEVERPDLTAYKVIDKTEM